MKKQLSIAMGLVLAGMASAPTMADDHMMGLEFSANVALTSDYIFRGISQNESDPAIQGGFDVAHTSGIYAGVWGSNVSENLFDILFEIPQTSTKAISSYTNLRQNKMFH